MMRSRLFGIVIALALVIGGVALAGGNGGGTYTVTADVSQAPSLFEKGRVMVRGVEVGVISDVEPRRDGVRVTLEISDGVELPADAHLSVIPITVIADRYVQIEPPYAEGAVLEDGDHIPLDRTTIPAELDDVLEQLQGLLAALEPRRGQEGPLASLINNLDDAVAGRSEEIAGTLEGGAAVLGNLAAREAEITGLIRHLDRLFVALADRASEIGIINESLQLVVEALADDQESLEGTIENVAFLSSQGAALINESGNDIGNAFGRLGRVLDRVLSHEESLAAGIEWSNVISQALGGTDSSGRGLYAYSGKQAPVGSGRAAYNYRIDTRDTMACERIGVLAERLQIINPSWGFEDVRHAILSYIPDEYQDDLSWLIDLLIPLCADLPEEAETEARAAAVVDAAASMLGRARLTELARDLVEQEEGR